MVLIHRQKSTYALRVQRKGAKMQYTIMITRKDGSQTTLLTEADNASHAHTLGLNECKKGDVLRVYATTTGDQGEILIDGVQAGALTVVKRTTANMISREGEDLQYRLYNECRRSEITDPDVKDCLSVAQLAIIEAIANGESIADQYHNAYLALNKHLRDNRQINLSVTAQRTVYIEDVDGEIISVNSKIARILSAGEKYTHLDDQLMDHDTADRLGAALTGAAMTLTPRQTQITKYVAMGYSKDQIAKKFNYKNNSTVVDHLSLIRKKYLEYFENNAAEFLPLIKAVEIREKNKKRNKDRHKNNAERLREYRKRKKQEKQNNT